MNKWDYQPRFTELRVTPRENGRVPYATALLRPTAGIPHYPLESPKYWAQIWYTPVFHYMMENNLQFSITGYTNPCSQMLLTDF